MLSELSDLQESNESVWSANSVSFSVETRSEENDEIVEREYTFAHAKEWDKWTFHEFEEKRTPNTESICDRNWRRTRHIYWDDQEARSVDVPPEVTKEIEEMLDLEKLIIQTQ